MIMTKTIEKIETGINSRDSIEEYLIRTYGKEKMDRVQQESINGVSCTHLDVIGYTLDKSGYETENIENGYHTHYELEEIEKMMIDNWDEHDEEDEDFNGEYSIDDYDWELMKESNPNLSDQ